MGGYRGRIPPNQNTQPTNFPSKNFFPISHFFSHNMPQTAYLQQSNSKDQNTPKQPLTFQRQQAPKQRPNQHLNPYTRPTKSPIKNLSGTKNDPNTPTIRP